MSTARQADIGALNAIRQRLEAAENANDADAIAAELSDDAVFMVPHAPPCEGKAASEALLRGALEDLHGFYNRHIVYTSAEIRVDQHTAFDRGTFVVDIEKKDGADPARFGGKYLWLYTRSDAGWKLARAIVSLDHQDEEEDEC